MNRRRFLTGTGWAAGAAALQGPVNVFLPFIQFSGGTRFTVLSDPQMWQAGIDEIFPQVAARPTEFVIVAGDVIGIDALIGANPGDPYEQWPPTLVNLATLGKSYHLVAGNHDWGSAWARPGAFHQPRPEALTAWTQFVGDRQWVNDLEFTRIVGLDFHDWTPENQAWIAAQLDTTKRKMVVSHYPLTGTSTKWQDKFFDWWDWWEDEKLAFFQALGVNVFVCGHRHQFGLSRVGSMAHIICPAVAPVVGDNGPELAPDGVIPVTIPTRGWLEFEDRPETLLCELYRNDGKLLAAWAL